MKTVPTIQTIEERATQIGIKMSDLCKRADVSVWTVNRYKNGSSDPLRKLKALAVALEEAEEELCQ